MGSEKMAAPKRVTVFGGSGFLGRHIVRELAAAGTRVRVAVRDPEGALFLKPMGDVGQIVPIFANVRDRASVTAAVQGVDAVVNLVGILHEGGAQKFSAVQAEGAKNVAEAAAGEGVAKMVHLSAIGVKSDHRSEYAKTKAAGEEAVRKAMPQATILRPSVVFGPQDDFFNRFGEMARLSPFLPLIGGGHTRFQPVYVGDVAEAAFNALCDDAYAGRTFELGGPDIFTFKEIMKLVIAYSGHKCTLMPIPFWAAKIQGAVLSLLPNPPITADQVELLKHDNVVGAGMPTLADIGVTATSVHAVLPTYMDIYRDGGRFNRMRPA